MYRILTKGTGTCMTVQTFTVVIRGIQFDICWLRRFPKILNVYVLEPPEFGTQTAVQAVVSVAGVAGLIRWHAMILEMCGWNV